MTTEKECKKSCEKKRSRKNSKTRSKKSEEPKKSKPSSTAKQKTGDSGHADKEGSANDLLQKALKLFRVSGESEVVCFEVKNHDHKHSKKKGGKECDERVRLSAYGTKPQAKKKQAESLIGNLMGKSDVIGSGGKGKKGSKPMKMLADDNSKASTGAKANNGSQDGGEAAEPAGQRELLKQYRGDESPTASQAAPDAGGAADGEEEKKGFLPGSDDEASAIDQHELVKEYVGKPTKKSANGGGPDEAGGAAGGAGAGSADADDDADESGGGGGFLAGSDDEAPEIDQHELVKEYVGKPTKKSSASKASGAAASGAPGDDDGGAGGSSTASGGGGGLLDEKSEPSKIDQHQLVKDYVGKSKKSSGKSGAGGSNGSKASKSTKPFTLDEGDDKSEPGTDTHGQLKDYAQNKPREYKAYEKAEKEAMNKSKAGSSKKSVTRNFLESAESDASQEMSDKVKNYAENKPREYKAYEKADKDAADGSGAGSADKPKSFLGSEKNEAPDMNADMQAYAKNKPREYKAYEKAEKEEQARKSREKSFKPSFDQGYSKGSVKQSASKSNAGKSIKGQAGPGGTTAVTKSNDAPAAETPGDAPPGGDNAPAGNADPMAADAPPPPAPDTRDQLKAYAENKPREYKAYEKADKEAKNTSGGSRRFKPRQLYAKEGSLAGGRSGGGGPNIQQMPSSLAASSLAQVPLLQNGKFLGIAGTELVFTTALLCFFYSLPKSLFLSFAGTVTSAGVSLAIYETRKHLSSESENLLGIAAYSFASMVTFVLYHVLKSPRSESSIVPMNGLESLITALATYGFFSMVKPN